NTVSPLLVRRGGCGIKKISGAAHLRAADGVVALKSHSGVSDHPVRSNKEASQHFLHVASTPPHEEGTTVAQEIFSKKQEVTHLLHKGERRASAIHSWIDRMVFDAIPTSA